MRYGELLGADGKTLNPMTSVAGQIKGANELPCIVNEGRTLANGLHVAFQQDTLTLSGGNDDWTPSWSWHGFRSIGCPAMMCLRHCCCSLTLTAARIIHCCFRYVELTVPSDMHWGPEEVGSVVCYPMRTGISTSVCTVFRLF